MAVEKVVLLLSGGIDSTACAAFFVDQAAAIDAIFIDYGQPAAAHERNAANRVADHFSIPLRIITWEGAKAKRDGLIIGRNAFLLLGGLIELTTTHALLAIGVHSGTSYRDCSPIFINQLQETFDLYTDGTVQIVAPFLYWTKRDILAYCRSRSVPLHLTYSCERGTSPPCGVCLSCLDREELYARS
jgi:7-cyano-7-deazaguanine synthase